jgi:PAS domain-containing protein
MKKKTKNPLSRNRIRNVERVRLEGVVQQQADELKIKNGQLRTGAEKQIRSEEQIHICTKAMESTADGIFIIDAQKQDFPVIYANQSVQKMTGFAKREILGRNYFLLYRVDVDPRIVNEIK